MKRISAFLLAMCLLTTPIPFTASAAIEGYHAYEGYYTYTVSGGEATITDVDTSISGDIVVPSMLGGYAVTVIDYASFLDCTSITNITIPNTVLYIGDYAFFGCSNLKSIEISESVSLIGFSIVGECANLEIITVDKDNVSYYSRGNCLINSDGVIIAGCNGSVIPTDGSIGSIMDEAFFGCEKLEQIVIPEGVTYIGDGAFAGCFELNNIFLPDSVTYIGIYAFESTAYWCDHNNREIDTGALYVGNHLIHIPNAPDNYVVKSGTVTIAGGAFDFCPDMTSVIIPNSVLFIGEKAFFDCENLENVYLMTSQNWKVQNSDGDIERISFVELSDSQLCAEYFNSIHNDCTWSPIDKADFDGDNSVTANDAIYLLYHVFFGDETYPLN